MDEQVIVEVNVGGSWREIGVLGPEHPPGSMSSEPPEEGRQVVLFGWRDGRPGVWRSRFGVDVEDPQLRLITSTAFDELSDLSEPYEFDRHAPTSPSAQVQRVRFRLT